MTDYTPVAIGDLPPGAQVRGTLYQEPCYIDSASILEIELRSGIMVDISWDETDPTNPYLIRVYREYYGNPLDEYRSPTAKNAAGLARGLAWEFDVT